MYGIYQCINNENPIRKWVQVMIDFHDILDCMNKHQQINSDKVFQRMVRCWQQDDIKSRILLQSCCGPRSTAVLDWAWPAWFSFNPKIHTEGEYRRREHVQKQFIEAYNKKERARCPGLGDSLRTRYVLQSRQKPGRRIQRQCPLPRVLHPAHEGGCPEDKNGLWLLYDDVACQPS